MADFAVWGEAIGRAMGCRELEFVEAYYSVLERQNVDAVEGTLVGPAILKFVETWPKDTIEWQGSPDSLLDELRKVAEAFRIDTRDSIWPKKGNSLTRRVKPLLSDLRQGYNIGITIERDTKGEKTKSKNSTWITIRKKSPSSPPPPPREGKNGDGGGDNRGGGSGVVGGGKSPPRDPTNAVHNAIAGGSGDSGGTFHIAEHRAAKPPDPNGDVSRSLGTDNYAAFDLEWTAADSQGDSMIYAGAIVDSHGNNTVLHISDFGGSERLLLEALTQELLRHPVTLGWYTTGIGQRESAASGGADEAS